MKSIGHMLRARAFSTHTFARSITSPHWLVFSLPTASEHGQACSVGQKKSAASKWSQGNGHAGLLAVKLLFLWSICVSSAHAQQGRYVWEDFSKRIGASQVVKPLGNDMFGDGVSLSNGALSFSASDVELPGHHNLPVRFARSYKMMNRRYHGDTGMLGDWDVEVPRLSGVFAPDWTVSPGTGQPASANRCSTVGFPKVELPFKLNDFFQGVDIQIPGVAEGLLLRIGAAVPKPADGAVYRWTSGNGQVQFSCLPSIKNGSGEGFLAITPDGTRYWFDWMAQVFEPAAKTTELLSGSTQGKWLPVALALRKNVLYATRVEDRFGNYVSYTYSNAWSAPGRLTKIQGSDGRTLTLNYTDNFVSSVSDGQRTWLYQYGATTSGRSTLTTVIQPDLSRWAINFGQFTNAELVFYDYPPVGEVTRTCFVNELPQNAGDTPTGTLVHPSGAMATFVMDIREHGRSSVPISCTNFSSPGNNPTDDVNSWTIRGWSFTLKQKRITGPGGVDSTWNYSYVPGISTYRYPGTTTTWPVCDWVNYNCSMPPCLSDACAGFSTTTVTGPGGVWKRYTHGNTYLYNEGKLLKSETGEAGQPAIRTAVHEYDLSMQDQVYPRAYGSSWGGGDRAFQATQHRPLKKTTITQDGATFSRRIDVFDVFARTRSVTAFSSLGYSKNNEVEYHDNYEKWVLGQPLRVTNTNADPDVVESRVEYDATTALPLRYFSPGTAVSPGKLVQSLTYASDGTVATVTDGNSQVITLGNWKRGIPQTIVHPTTPESPAGSTLTATVDDLGWIRSVVDESGSKTCYDYDPMGRLALIQYPSETSPGVCDASAYNETSQVFEPVLATEYGIAANHWRQTISTGNARKVTYYDAMWRPLVTQEYDTANVAGTQRFQRFTYDHEGRVTFASYPGTTDALASGTFTFHDALGRVTSTVQDSEFGASQPVTTSIAYLPGFITSTTNPRGEVTLTSYKAYDQPSTDWPMVIKHPEGQLTSIARDPWGKPTSLTRSGGGLSVTRSYVYDSHQQLCYSLEPETLGTVMEYDGAGNLSWSASGQPVSPGTTCNATRSAVTNKVLRTYDARNRLGTLAFPDGRGNQAWSYTKDGLPAQITTSNLSGGEQVVNSYTYNKRRLLTGEGMSQPGAGAWSLGYAYDGNGALAGITYPQGNYVNYAPNALGQATRAGPYATGVQYFPNGAIKQFTYGNGIVHTMLQNARQLPARSSDIGGGTALDLAYTYDKNTNVASITDYVDGRQTRSMTYDALDRLKTTTSVMFGGDNVASYTYNALDDITTLRVGGSRDHTYVYDGATRRLMNVKNTAGLATVVGLDYDVRGNLKQKNGQLYDFTFGNRLRSATNQETYRYDGHGRRVRASSATGNILSMYGQDGVLRRQEDWRTGKLTDYIYLGGSLVARVSNAPTLAAPTLTAPGYNTSGSYTVQWSAVTSANAYQLEEQVDGGIWQQVYAGAAQSKAISGKAGGAYGYRARGCLAAVCGSWSAVVTVAVQLPPVLAPSLSVPAAAVNGNFTVSWGTVATATSYTLEQSANGGAWTVSYTGAAQSKAFTNIGAGSFSYRVKACNPAGCGDLSGTGTTQALYPPATPAAPNVPATNTTGSYTVSWTAVASATAYRLEESSNGGAWVEIQNTGALSRAITGKAAGGYNYRLRACNAAGCGGYSGTSAVQRAPTAAPSTNAPASAPGGNYTVSWTAVATASTYVLEESNGAGWVQIRNANLLNMTFASKPGGVYSYRALGCNFAGCGGYSNTVVVDVPPPIPSVPPNPRAFYAIMDGIGTRYVFQWDASEGATYYETNGTIVYSGSGLSASRTISGAHVPTRGFVVRACNANGCSAWSPSVRSTPLGGIG